MMSKGVRRGVSDLDVVVVPTRDARCRAAELPSVPRMTYSGNRRCGLGVRAASRALADARSRSWALIYGSCTRRLRRSTTQLVAWALWSAASNSNDRHCASKSLTLILHTSLM